MDFFIWTLEIWLWTLALAEEKESFFQLPHLIKQLSLFSNDCMFIFFAPSIAWPAFQYVTYFWKMPSQHIFHDISENCCSLNFSIFVCFSLIKLIKPLGPHFRNVSNSTICGIFFQQNETITTFRAPLWRGVVSVPHPAAFPLAVSMSVCPSRPETDSFFLSNSENSILPFFLII